MIRGILITLLWFPLLGAATSRLVGRGHWYLLGIGICGFSLFGLGLLGIGVIPGIVILTVAAVAVLWIVPPKATEEIQWYPRAASLVMWIPLIVLLAVALIIPLSDFDGRAFWLLKAHAIAQEGGINGPFFRGESSPNPRNAYPLLLPLDAAAVMLMAGDADDMQLRWFYVFIVIAFALHLRRELASIFSPPIGAWCAALLVWLPRFSVHNEGGPLTAYADIAVAAFATCALFELLRGESPLRFGLWIAFLAVTKNEGLPLSLILFPLGVVFFRLRVWRALPPYGLALAMLAAWRHRVSISDEQDFVGQLLELPQRIDRLVPAAQRTLPHLFTLSEWGLFWIVAIAAAIFLLVQRERRIVAICLWFIAAFGGMYVAVYTTTRWNMTDLIDQAMPRLLMHFVGPAMILLAAAAQRFERTKSM